MGQLIFKDTQKTQPWNNPVVVVPPAVDVFIETGTCAGDTLNNAIEVYNECHSIECYRPAYLNVIKNFLHQPRAKIYYGSSPEVLPSIIDPKKSTLFWLDAHYVPDFGQYEIKPEIDVYGQCPLLAELDAILAVEWQAQIYILIDDAHIFEKEFWDATPIEEETLEKVKIGENIFLREGLHREDWPTIEQIKEKLPKRKIEIIPSSNVIMVA